MLGSLLELKPGHPLVELLLEQGYLLTHPIRGPRIEEWSGGWLAAPDRLPWLRELAERGTLCEQVDLETLARGQGLVGWVGDARQAWFYQPREHDPCLECLLGRWRQGLGHLQVWSHLPLAFEPLAEESLKQLAAAAVSRPGEIQLHEGGRHRSLAFLPVPGCQRCQPVKSPPRRSWLGHRLAIIKSVRRWGGSRPPVYVAHLHPGALTGLLPFAAGSGCASEPRQARRCALAEALERYSAAYLPPDVELALAQDHELWSSPFSSEQLDRPGFGYPRPISEPQLALTVREIGTRQRVLAPLARVLLTPCPPAPRLYPCLSHGLAAGTSLKRALRRAILELRERDAVARFWLRGEAQALGPELWAIHETVVALVRDQQGRPAFGSAAGPRALKRARCEALHNLAWLQRFSLSPPGEMPRSYHEHLAYYWHNPERLRLPSLRAPAPQPSCSFYWRELTPPDVAAIGLRVVRVVAPQLLYPPPCHDEWPHGESPMLPHPFG